MTETTYNLNYKCYKALIWSFLILVLVVYSPLFQCFGLSPLLQHFHHGYAIFEHSFGAPFPFPFVSPFHSLFASLSRLFPLGLIHSIEQIMNFCFVYIIKLFIYIRKVLLILVCTLYLVGATKYICSLVHCLFFGIDIGRVVSPLYCSDSNDIAFESVKWITNEMKEKKSRLKCIIMLNIYCCRKHMWFRSEVDISIKRYRIARTHTHTTLYSIEKYGFW